MSMVVKKNFIYLFKSKMNIEVDVTKALPLK